MAVDPTSIAFIIGAIVGAFISGVIVGCIPLILGFVKKLPLYGVIGFMACIIGSLILGLFLSIPICILFVALIFAKSKSVKVGAFDIQDIENYQEAESNQESESSQETDDQEYS